MSSLPVLSPSTPHLRIERISKSYPLGGHSVPALQNVSFSIPQGTILGIMGKSGAGKSTLLRCLNSLERPDTGSVFFKDQNLTSCSLSQLRKSRRHIGMIFQGFNLLSRRTALENITLPLEIAGIPFSQAQRRAQECLELVGLRDKANAYPGHLSGGQKQRVAIARALACDAQVLLCDEATSALDPDTTEEILGLLRDLNHRLGLTIVLITHDISVIRHLCHQVCVLHEGHLVEEGPTEEIFLRPQHPITQSFVSSIFTLKIPELIKERLSPVPLTGVQQVVLRLVFQGPVSQEPIVSQFIKTCPTPVNIIAGYMDHIGHTPFGILMVSLPFQKEGSCPVFEFLNRKNILVETLGYLPPHD
jgi:D-methionine transport system ATP-binding protein